MEEFFNRLNNSRKYAVASSPPLRYLPPSGVGLSGISFPPKRERSRFLLRGFVASAYRYARMNFRGNRPAFSIRNHQQFPCVAPVLTLRLGRAPWATLRPNPRSAPVQAALGCRSRTRFARGIEG